MPAAAAYAPPSPASRTKRGLKVFQGMNKVVPKPGVSSRGDFLSSLVNDR